MSEPISLEEVWKLNVIALARDHRAKCDESCGISLYLLRQMAEAAGIKFDDEERRLFI